MKFDFPFRSLSDVERFEGEKTLEERCPWRSVYDIFSYAADRFGDAPALSFIKTGEQDEAPRDVLVSKIARGYHPRGQSFSIRSRARAQASASCFRIFRRRILFCGERRPPDMPCRSIFCCRPLISQTFFAPLR